MKKKSKKRSSEAANKKKPPKKLNPFEIHVNRRKHNVIGMKSKAEKGLPGVSRSKAISKRKATLLQEYRRKDKTNIFLDKRIGERNRAMTEEDKIVARYTAERMRSHSKKSRYNLGDTEELTHWGQSITEVEKFDDPRSDDEDEDDRPGKLDSDFVKDAHFGGGMLRKVDGDGNSRQSLIDQLIAESKKRKIEKQRAREQTIDLTQKLDSEWKELLPLVTVAKRKKGEEEEQEANKKEQKFATYDKLSKELKFEPRAAVVSDKLKSEEEIAREEKERLEKLEKERQERMFGEPDVKEKIKHRSADDLDDGFVIDKMEEFSEDERNGVIDDKSNGESEEEEEDNEQEGAEEEEGEEEEDNEVEQEESEEEEEEKDIEDVKEANTHNMEESENDNEVEEEENSKEIEGDKEEEEESDDESLDLSDLKESDESDEEEVKQTQRTHKKETKTDSKADLEKKNNLNKEINELPFTFDIPDSYEDFENLMTERSPEIQGVIVERMIKCNHPSLRTCKKEKLDLLYTFLLQHLQDCSTDDNLKYHCFKILDKLSPWLFDLTQWAPDNATKSIEEVIKEKYEDFLKTKKVFPDLDTLIFLKLVSILYPTSDYRHKIVTPSLQFMEEILSSCRVTTSIDVSVGLFITTLIFEYTALSKRYVPEAVNFLRGILRLAHSKDLKIPTVPPFKLSDIDSFSLRVSDLSASDDCDLKMSVKDLIDEGDLEEFKIKSLNLALNLLNRFCSFWGEEPSSYLIFEPFVPLLDVQNYPICLRQAVKGVLNNILNLKNKPLVKLMLEKKKPRPLRLYEPEVEQIYTFKKHKPMPEDRRERAKLIHKVKQETKGALREIRRDRQFLAKVRYKEALKSDMERKRKVKEIFGAAAQQMGELKKFKKRK